MAFPTRKLTAVCEITTGQLHDVVLPPAHEGEAGAIEVSVKLEYGGSAASVSGMKPSMYLYDKLRDAMTDSVDMALSGSTITGTMPEAFFAISSRMLLCLVLTDTASGCTMTVGTLPLEVKNVRGGTVLSTRAPSISEVVYVGRAPYLSSGNTWMVWDTSTGKYKDSGVSAVGAGTFFAAPESLLDNNDFSDLIAQAGLNGTHCGEAYLADRWGTYKVTGEKKAGYVTLNASIGSGRIFQRTKVNGGRNYTFVANVKCSDRFYLGAYQTDGTQIKAKSWTGGEGVFCMDVIIPNNVSIVEWRFYPAYTAGGTADAFYFDLYEGVFTPETVPTHIRKRHTADLAECQSYYYRFEAIGNSCVVAHGSCFNDSNARLEFCLPQEMIGRMPTFAFTPGSYNRIVFNNTYVDIENITLLGTSGNKAYLNCYVSGLVASTLCGLLSTGCVFEFSYDL